LHLNGNSLYCLVDTALDEYLARVQQASPHGCGSRDSGWGFDWAMYLYRTQSKDVSYLRFVRHKFMATDLLANFGKEPLDGSLPASFTLLHSSASFDDRWDTLRCRRGEAGQPPAPTDAGTYVQPRASNKPPGECPLVALEETFAARDVADSVYTAYELTGSAALADGGGGVVLTDGMPSQGGHVEFVSALDRSKLCAQAGCDLTFVMSWTASAENGTLGDGLALSLADASLEVPLSVRYTAVSGVVVPYNSVSLVIDEFDNGDGIGVWLAASSDDGSATILARFANASAVNTTAAFAEARLTLSNEGWVSAMVKGQLAFEGVPVALPKSMLLVVSANTGDSRGVHRVGSVHACGQLAGKKH
jgi:hypothetical protein